MSASAGSIPPGKASRGALLALGAAGAAIGAIAIAYTARSPGGPARPDPVPAAEAQVVRLRDLPFAALELPPTSRADGKVPDRIPLDGPWYPDSSGPRSGFTMAIPVRPRGLFFFKPEPGIAVVDTKTGDSLAYDRGPQTPGGAVWVHDREELSIWFSTSRGAPEPGEFALVYPTAKHREEALNFALAGKTPEAFAWTEIQDGWDARLGLLLPAPGRAAWELTVPPSGELSFTSGIVPPEVAGESSDGARVAFRVTADGTDTPVFAEPVAVGEFVRHRVDLSAWAGRAVTLTAETEPGGTPVGDYVFLAEPIVASRVDDPVTVLMVFIDTLRPDHMSLFGYSRDTTAAIDHLRNDARVFRRAYSVAPWTLPAARAVITGRQPEAYAVSDTLPGILGKRGWATAFFAGNVYLSVNFGMNRDWDLHRIGGMWPPATQVTDDALQWLDEHDGQNALLQVHYMDAHLPYHEPEAYRGRYAGDAHPKLGEEFFLSDVKRANIGRDEAALDYIRARYDNNIRFATDQIERLIQRLDDNDVLVLYGDHGEEFYEHNGYEHGHALFDELIHVPLVVRAPGVPTGRDVPTVDVPVSLLDLTPTILDLVGEPLPETLDGWSLAPLLRGDADAPQRFLDRDLAFGRPLYGTERWGVLADGRQKWTTNEGREALYDLANDPGERQNLLVEDPNDGGRPFREKLAAALDRPVPVAYRLTPTVYRGAPKYGLWALCTVPGGFDEVWAGQDPLLNSAVSLRPVEDPAELTGLLAAYQITDHPLAAGATGVEMCWPAGYMGSREVYLVPHNPLPEAGPQMVCSGFLGDASGGKRATMRMAEGRFGGLGANRVPFNRLVWPERQLMWQFGIAPIPVEGQVLVARDAETDGMLQAIGYQTGDEAELPHPTAEVPEGERLGELPACEPPMVTLAPMDAPPEIGALAPDGPVRP